MDNKYGIFLILRGKKDQSERSNIPIITFLAKDYTNARIYFKSFIEELKNKELYKLYKIGYLNKQNEIEPCKIFITGGLEICSEPNKDYLQLKFIDKENTKEIIKKLFDGMEIK